MLPSEDHTPPPFAPRQLPFAWHQARSSLTGTLLDLLDRQRVEILRGPQGTLAGKNSIGDAIKLCFAPLNVGSAHIKGIEVETTLRPVDGLLIDASASYLDFNYTKINPDTGVVPGDISPYTPQWQWSLGAQCEIPVSDLGSITPRVDVSYQSTTWSLAANSLLNARLTWRSPEQSWQVALEATNLTSKYYLLSKQVPSGSGSINGQPGMPRRYAESVRKKF